MAYYQSNLPFFSTIQLPYLGGRGEGRGRPSKGSHGKDGGRCRQFPSNSLIKRSGGVGTVSSPSSRSVTATLTASLAIAASNRLRSCASRHSFSRSSRTFHRFDACVDWDRDGLGRVCIVWMIWKCRNYRALPHSLG